MAKPAICHRRDGRKKEGKGKRKGIKMEMEKEERIRRGEERGGGREGGCWRGEPRA